MLNSLLSNRERLMWLTGVTLTLLWFIIYLTTVSPTVNFIDSGELITAAQEPGIAHPPGYPLYTLLGYVVSHLLWGEVAWRVNVLSAFWGAMAAGAFFILTFQLSDYLLAGQKRTANQKRRTSTPIGRREQASPQQRKKPADRAVTTTRADKFDSDRTESPQPEPMSVQAVSVRNKTDLLLLAAASAGASLLAVSATFWSRTAQAKMYTLHFFFAATILILALGFRRAYERRDDRAATRWLIAVAATLGLSFTNHLMTLLLVIPAGLMLLLGADFMDRLRFILRRLLFAIPAFILPLLLYIYMPIRASQDPLMNWGSVDNWGDFYRHISGWQFQTYLVGDIRETIGRNFELITGYAMQQWGFLSIFVFLAGFAAGALLFRARQVVFWPIYALLVITFGFSMFYGISEIEPYMTLFYAMLAVSVGLAPAAWLVIARENTRPGTQRNTGSRTIQAEQTQTNELSQSWMLTALAGIMIVGSFIVNYPQQNYSNNRLAEQFALNAFNELPLNSIVITDYWDFHAPTYYLQVVKKIRPDLAIIDKSLLRYPWYTGQLRKLHPWLIDNSQDILTTFATEQRKWVNGEEFNQPLLNQSYFDLMTSFVERNQAEHPAYIILGVPCQPNNQSCEGNLIAPSYQRIPAGLSDRLVPPNTAIPLPATEPAYKTEGITANFVGFDDAAKLNSARYVDAYARLAALYGSQGQTDAAQRMNAQASIIEAALKGR